MRGVGPRRAMWKWVALLALLASRPAGPAHAQGAEPSLLWVQGGPYRLKTSIFRSSVVSANPVLVVVLHGDAPFNKPDYQDTFAAKVAQTYRDVVVAAILRPGYTDPRGNTSDGERGEATGDNYNARNTDAIAAAVGKLRERFHSRRVVLVGHSGGAAIAANILSRHPALIDAALLASCPCDVTRWRELMFQKTRVPGFRGTIATLSPIELVEGLSDQVAITMVVGDKDDVAPPSLSESYQAKASKLGKHVRLVQLKGEGHEILLNPAVLAEVGPLLSPHSPG
jgi:pimeloyl-ACP methyl ester carboxylesterase